MLMESFWRRIIELHLMALSLECFMKTQRKYFVYLKLDKVNSCLM